MKEKNPDLKQVLRDLLGIQVSVSSMARLLSPSEPVSPWGLMVLDTGGGLHFISFRQKNWVSALFTSGEGDEGLLRIHERYLHDEIRSLVREKKGFLSSLLNPSCRYALSLKGREEPLLFELESPDRSFLKALDEFSCTLM